MKAEIRTRRLWPSGPHRSKLTLPKAPSFPIPNGMCECASLSRHTNLWGIPGASVGLAVPFRGMGVTKYPEGA
jgi:hypothetical protein